MRASLVTPEVRDRLLDVASLLSAEADDTGSATVAACASELRAICGLAVETSRRSSRSRTQQATT
jgi:hypothetical protein